MARKAAQELKNGSSLYTFPPMHAGDRRIIHMTMKEEGFLTESRGRGEEKKVVALTSQ
jgi:predicted RNA-binding protein Jag